MIPYNQIKSTLGERMREVRNSLDWSQEYMAKKINVARTSLVLYESDSRVPNATVIGRFIGVTGVSPYYILDVENPERAYEQEKLANDRLRATLDQTERMLKELLKIVEVNKN